MLTRLLPRITLASAIFLGFAASCYADGPRLGMAIKVEGDGFFLNPVITKLLVTKVEKASMAERAGIAAGDEIIQVEGQNVVGRRARELEPLMKFGTGESRTLRLKHANGEQFEARLTKPKE